MPPCIFIHCCCLHDSLFRIFVCRPISLIGFATVNHTDITGMRYTESETEKIHQSTSEDKQNPKMNRRSRNAITLKTGLMIMESQPNPNFGPNSFSSSFVLSDTVSHEIDDLPFISSAHWPKSQANTVRSAFLQVISNRRMFGMLLPFLHSFFPLHTVYVRFSLTFFCWLIESLGCTCVCLCVFSVVFDVGSMSAITSHTFKWSLVVIIKEYGASAQTYTPNYFNHNNNNTLTVCGSRRVNEIVIDSEWNNNNKAITEVGMLIACVNAYSFLAWTTTCCGCTKQRVQMAKSEWWVHSRRALALTGQRCLRITWNPELVLELNYSRKLIQHRNSNFYREIRSKFHSRSSFSYFIDWFKLWLTLTENEMIEKEPQI